MPDIKVSYSIDVAGLKTNVVMPALTVDAIDRVTVKLARHSGSDPPAARTISVAPSGAALSFVLMTADAYIAGTTRGVRILRASDDTDGIKLEAPVLFAGPSLLASIPLQAHELLVVNDSTEKDITVEILIGRMAVS